MNDDFLLMIEMYGDNDLKATPSLPELPALDLAIEKIDARPDHTWAAGALVREIVQRDFLQSVLGDIPEPVVKTTPVGDDPLLKEMVGPVLPAVTVIPASKPNASTATKPSKRKQLQAMLKPLLDLYSGIRSAAVEESIQDLLDDMEVYVEDCKAAAKWSFVPSCSPPFILSPGRKPGNGSLGVEHVTSGDPCIAFRGSPVHPLPKKPARLVRCMPSWKGRSTGKSRIDIDRGIQNGQRRPFPRNRLP